MKTQKEIFSWLKANLGKHCLGVLTSTDSAALVASVNLSNLINYESAPEDLFAAYRAIIAAMQPQSRHLAYHAIACELDWNHRRMIWCSAGMAEWIPGSRCVWERRESSDTLDATKYPETKPDHYTLEDRAAGSTLHRGVAA